MPTPPPFIEVIVQLKSYKEIPLAANHIVLS